MKYNPAIHHRRSIRLQGYDYSQPGAYFITIVTHNRQCFFGDIIDGKMDLNECGKIAYNEWIKLPNRYPHIKTDVFQIMPNHTHGIITVGATLAVAPDIAVVPVAQNDNKGAGASPAPTIDTVKTVAVGNIVGAYKSLVANECLKIFKSKNEFMGKLWQRNYYEHIVRNDDELNRIREYIISNPIKWELDKENPNTMNINPI